MGRYRVETLGCRVNLADSLALAARLEAAGHERAAAAADADLVVVNTCTVTGRADADARRLVRRLARAHPRARLVLTGCLVEASPEEVARWPGVAAVVPRREQRRLPLLLAAAEGGEREGERSLPDAAQGTLWDAPTAYPQVAASGHTRAFVKVQDGCDARCSFCVIPRTRGRSRSLAPEEVARAVGALAASGAREVVITGIHLGHYGRDLGTSLEALLDRLLALPAPERLRLTSIEPNEVTPGLLARIAGSERMAPHLHLPLQSGSDRVLARMRRPYTAGRYARTVERVARALPWAGIGADVIAGFPGESEAEFAATVALARSLPLTYLHPFRWSARRGTEAERLPGRLPAEAADGRGRALRALSADLEERFVARLEGRAERALTLAGAAEGTDALTGSFVHVRLPGRLEPNRLLPVRLGGRSGGRPAAAPLA